MRSITVGELPGAVGTDLGASRWFDVNQARVDGFAEATEDRQWIHVDSDRARRGPFGTTIAHGFLTLSLLSAGVEDLLTITDAAMLVNYGLDRVRFLAPVPVGSRVRVAARIAAVSVLGDRSRVELAATVEIEDGAKPACVAQLVMLAVGQGGAV